jgi:hypothetical protein
MTKLLPIKPVLRLQFALLTKGGFGQVYHAVGVTQASPPSACGSMGRVW